METRRQEDTAEEEFRKNVSELMREEERDMTHLSQREAFAMNDLDRRMYKKKATMLEMLQNGIAEMLGVESDPEEPLGFETPRGESLSNKEKKSSRKASWVQTRQIWTHSLTESSCDLHQE